MQKKKYHLIVLKIMGQYSSIENIWYYEYLKINNFKKLSKIKLTIKIRCIYIFPSLPITRYVMFVRSKRNLCETKYQITFLKDKWMIVLRQRKILINFWTCEGSIFYTAKLEYKNTDVANLRNCTKSYLVPAKLV